MTVRDLRIVVMREEQLEEAAAVMARAFADDPLFAAGFPDSAERARAVPWIARWNVHHGLRFGTVLVTADVLVGAAITYRTSASPFTEAQMAAADGPVGEQLAAWKRVEPLFAAADAHLSAAVPEPHWYLDMVAVDPAHQGAGVGSALLRTVHARADADG